ASRTVTSDGSGSYSTSTAKDPSRAASNVSASTQHTACPLNITSPGNNGSSCFTPASFTPGTSSAVNTRTTPGTSYAGFTRSAVTRAWACGDWTGQACSTSQVRITRSSVYKAVPVRCRAALSCGKGT